jgi:hypothetical protein
MNLDTADQDSNLERHAFFYAPVSVNDRGHYVIGILGFSLSEKAHVTEVDAENGSAG